jgi:hypothetical protein
MLLIVKITSFAVTYNLEDYFQPHLQSNVVFMALLLLFSLDLLYTTRNVHESRIGLKLNNTHHLDKYADNLYIVFVDKFYTIKEQRNSN